MGFLISPTLAEFSQCCSTGTVGRVPALRDGSVLSVFPHPSVFVHHFHPTHVQRPAVSAWVSTAASLRQEGNDVSQMGSSGHERFPASLGLCWLENALLPLLLNNIFWKKNKNQVAYSGAPVLQPPHSSASLDPS